MVTPLADANERTRSNTDTGAAIDVRAVSKTFRGKVRALQQVSIRVEPGEIFGLLGPNGAGKSTLVKILMTIVRPSRCEGDLLGAPVGHKPTLARVGYLPEHLRFPEYLTGAQALHIYAALAGVPRKERKARASELLNRVGMNDWARKHIKAYSKGMKQRMGVAQALMNEPDLVLLDEPTDGVDPTGRRDIRELVREMKREGKTVFINSHLLSELEMVCDRVAILVKGRVVEQGLVSELAAADSRYQIELAAAPTATPALTAALHGAHARLETPSNARALPSVIAPAADAEAIQPIIDALRAQGATIVAVRPQQLSLEDLFMRAVEQPGMGGVGAEQGKSRTPRGDNA